MLLISTPNNNNNINNNNNNANRRYPPLEFAQPEQEGLAGWFEVRDDQLFESSTSGLDPLAHFPHTLTETRNVVWAASRRRRRRRRKKKEEEEGRRIKNEMRRTDSVRVVSRNRSRSGLGTPVTRKYSSSCRTVVVLLFSMVPRPKKDGTNQACDFEFRFTLGRESA
jgi:hypothetical protein